MYAASCRNPSNCTCIFPCIQLSGRSFRCPLSRGLSGVDSSVTAVTNHQGLSPAGCHDFDPPWPLFSLFVEVCEFADVVNFYVFPRPAYFAFVCKEPFDQLVTF